MANAHERHEIRGRITVTTTTLMTRTQQCGFAMTTSLYIATDASLSFYLLLDEPAGTLVKTDSLQHVFFTSVALIDTCILLTTSKKVTRNIFHKTVI